jgi:hypothetical protein
LWIDSDTGITYTYYYDGDSYQWVEFGPEPTGPIGNQGTQGLQGTFGPATVPLSTDTSGSGDTILATDNGKLVVITGGLTIANVFAVGENCVIYNDSAIQVAITTSTGVQLRLSGTSSTGTRYLQQRGVATVICVKSGEYAISGAGVT